MLYTVFMSYVHIIIVTIFWSIASFVQALPIIQVSTLSNERITYTKEYASRHYGLNHYHIIQPKIIVLHSSSLPSLKTTMNAYKAAEIPDLLEKLKKFGKLNLSSHFVVDRNGTIYQLTPTSIIARHTMGLNHTAIGITNVARNNELLTDDQVQANIDLVAYIKGMHPSIKHVIGNIEYMNRNYAHYQYFISKDPAFQPMIRIDPGWKFVNQVRKGLFEQYGLKFKK